MRVSFPYGTGFHELELPAGAVIIEPRAAEALADERASFLASVREPIGAAPLRECISSGDRVVIVTSDNTRPLPNAKLVPWIIEELRHVPPENFTVLIGTGSHRACSAAEIREMFGNDVSRTLRIVNHDAFDAGGLGKAGVTDRGGEIFLNREYLEADTRITLGFIEPHFFAGFSGGPKAVMPGIAGIDAIMRFHSAPVIDDPRATWGLLRDNPVYEMASRAACLVKPDFSIQVTLGPGHGITGFFCGDVLAAHRAGAVFARESSMRACDTAFDIVITSNSGHPLDRNFYQAVKGICAAGEIVAGGGRIISLSHCGEGIPDDSEFHEILKSHGTPGGLLDMIRDPSFARPEAWQVQKLAAVLARAEVHLFSAMQRDKAADTHCMHCADPVALLARFMKEKPDARVAALRFGPLSIPYIRERGGL
ncbi:MAG TPA: nickel-dependent lactate racemase [Spirochaetota bacterium]|nr:nickel-dependent lactate racemase [Spirochaetota bacterium]